MFPKFNTRLLRAEATEQGEAGGGAAPAEAPATQEAPAAPEAKPGVVSQAIALLKTKQELNGEIHGLRQQVADSQATIDRLTAENTLLKQTVAGHEADLGRLTQALTTAAAEAQTVDQAAAAKLRSHGVEPEKLPAATQEAAEETREQLEARLAKSADNKERFEIAAKLNALD